MHKTRFSGQIVTVTKIIMMLILAAYMVQYILYSFHIVAVSSVEVNDGEIGTVRSEVEQAFLKLLGVHTRFLKECLWNLE